MDTSITTSAKVLRYGRYHFRVHLSTGRRTLTVLVLKLLFSSLFGPPDGVQLVLGFSVSILQRLVVLVLVCSLPGILLLLHSRPELVLGIVETPLPGCLFLLDLLPGVARDDALEGVIDALAESEIDLLVDVLPKGEGLAVDARTADDERVLVNEAVGRGEGRCVEDGSDGG
ncbi:hypothetical protein BKA70DRAFT_1298564 [Coprinopsis sp. MPI-PUGE-AT-0042]|nr:hypothetical protein BKA70DRAFT_1298564 [Coprinopsis sp. MPI-PUGE-AT-0042]